MSKSGSAAVKSFDSEKLGVAGVLEALPAPIMEERSASSAAQRDEWSRRAGQA
uniref:Uncharacterized protein n=1 Tax=Mycobacterium riyadhense TaxID=486698 RepID=A0A653EYX8_9MYCO|nr:hypothetical protein BIN_B_04564 [Mycobacterium riyadhense]